jgi:hypothetical protein
MSEENNLRYAVIYIPDEDTYGELLSFGYIASTVSYVKDGMSHEVIMLNEDFEIIEEINIEEIEEY